MTHAKILVVKPVLPYPPEQGTKVVSFAIVEALSRAHDVTVLARIIDREEAEHAASLGRWCAHVETVFPRNRASSWARVAYRLGYTLRSLLTGRSMKSLYDCPGAFVRAARRLASEPFDLIIVEYWQLYPLLDVFPKDRTVLLTHDIDLLINRGRAGLERGLVARARAHRRLLVEEREEVRAYRTAARICALTERDATAVRTLSGGRATVGVLPFGLPEQSFTPAPAARNPGEILFMGAMGAPFNRDAIGHFVRDIHPHLASLPGTRFTVVGGALPSEVAFFGHSRNVEIVGHTPDPGRYLARAMCLVVPLRFGGGLRIRILEALAAGLPVVSSPLAVEGMDLEAGEHVLIAGSPGEYRAHVERLLLDPGYAASLSERARARVYARYGPATRYQGLLAWADRAMAPAARPSGREAITPRDREPAREKRDWKNEL